MAVKGVSLRLLGDDSNIKEKLKAVGGDVEGLKKLAGNIKLDLNDKLGRAKLARFTYDLDKLGKKVAEPRVTTGGLDRAILKVATLDAALDRLDNKKVGSRISIGTLITSPFSGNSIKRLLTGNAGSMGGLSSFLTSPVGIGAGATAIGLLTSLLPGLLGGGLTLGVGGAGILGAKALDPKGFAAALKPLSGMLKAVFGGIPKLIEPSIRQLAGFVRSLAPELKSLFTAALPGLEQFIKALEPTVKAILPQLTSVIKSMTPFMASLGSSFGLIIRGIVGALVNMRGAFKDSAEVIHGTAEVLDVVFRSIGTVVSVVTHQFVAEMRVIDDLVHGKWAKAWHDALKFFDAFGAGVVGLWKRNSATVLHGLDVFRHAMADGFDRLRADLLNIWGGQIRMIQSLWNSAWNNIIGATMRGVTSVEMWFGRMVSSVGHILASLPGILFNIGRGAIGSLLSGLKSAAGPLISFINWIRSLVSSVTGFFGGGHPTPGTSTTTPSGAATRGTMLGISAPVVSSTAPARAPSGGFMVVNITVAGDTDPYGAARRIHQELRKYKKQVLGNMELGLA